jgi:acetyl esterase/lipase
VIENATSLDVNTKALALGGLSAGGGMTAILAMRIAERIPAVHPRFQMLICPVIDCTADITTGWSTSRHSPWLTPSRMQWYREKYFTDDAQSRNWDASPCFAPKTLLQKSPPSYVAVAECDLLAPEGLAYAESLRAAGVATEIKVCKGATHSVLGLAG